MNLADFDYPLPKDLIAQGPLAKRDSSRLLVCDRKTSALQDKIFNHILDLIPAGDMLVLNNTRVFKARILGNKKATGGKVDLLLLSASDHNTWRCLAQPALKEGVEILFPESVEAKFVGRDPDGMVRIQFPEALDVAAWSQRVGTMPLPPYIKREAGKEDEATYQTVYAKTDGAVAAPTAGLHFTQELLDKLKQKGVGVEYVTLHVGYGTFKPVDDLDKHQMHSETFEMTPETADRINKAKAQGKKIWAVGTTTLRVLETCVVKKVLVPGKGETNLFIREPFPFEAVDRLITNFHLPKTTLLLLVSAFMGESFRKRSYEHAIAEKYRFYSYGDAMVII